MQTITVKIHVPREVAIAAKRVNYGDTDYEISPEELGQLKTNEAVELLRYEGKEATERLVLSSFDGADPWPHIRLALATAAVETAAANERKAARADARLLLHSWAISQHLFPLLREAARKEYDISSLYVFELAKLLSVECDPCLAGTMPPIITCTEQLDKNIEVEPRASPSLFAMTLHDRLQHEVTERQSRLAPGTKIDLSQVSRLTPKDGGHQTVVLVRIAHPATPYGATIIWSAEDHRPLTPALVELRDPGPTA
jgi:hypothetical protein